MCCAQMLWQRSQDVSSIVRAIRANSKERGVHCTPARHPPGSRASLIKICAPCIGPPRAATECGYRFGESDVAHAAAARKERNAHCRSARRQLEGGAVLISICAPLIRMRACCGQVYRCSLRDSWNHMRAHAVVSVWRYAALRSAAWHCLWPGFTMWPAARPH